MGKEVNKRVNVFINGKEVENNIKSIRAAMAQLTNQLNKMTIGSDEYNKTSEDLKKLKKIYDDHVKSLKSTREEVENLSNAQRDNVIVTGALVTTYSTYYRALQKFVSSTQQYVEAYAAIDDAMTNVSKYTGLTREEVEQLNEEFKKIDTRTTTEKLNALAADAGRLGITSKKAVKDFVEAADIINTALGEDLGDDAVKNIGKMAQMFGESETMGLRGAMIATASAVNSLGQSSSASEPYIVEFTSRLAGVANTAGITQANIMGIASAMDQNMGQVERSSTAVQKVMMDMMSKTEKYAELVGMTSDEFKNLVDSDMNTAFLSVLEALNSISQQGGSALAETLSDLKLKGAGVQETLMTLSKNTDQLREAQTLAAQAYSDGNSVIKEAEAVNSNAAAQLEKAKKKLEELKAELGEKLIPIITQLYKKFASTATWISKHTALIKAIAVVVGLYVSNIVAYKTTLAAANIVTAVTNALHKTHRTALLASAAAQALYAKNTTRSNAAIVLMKKELPGLTSKLSNLGGAFKTIGSALRNLIKIGPAAFLAAVAAAVVHVNREANEGKRIVKEISKEASEAMAQSRADIDVERIKIDALRSIINDENVSRENKLKAIKELQSIIPGYVAELSEEGRVVKENTKDIDEYIERITRESELRVLESSLEKLQAKRNEIEDEYNDARKKYYDGNFFQKVHQTIWHDMDETNNTFVRKLTPINDQIDETLAKMRSIQEGIINNSTLSPSTEENGNNVGNGSEIKHNDSDPEHCMCPDCVSRRKKETESRAKEYESKWKSLNDKVKSLRNKYRNDNKEGWDKIKSDITNEFDELIKEASKFGKAGKKLAKELSAERDNAIIAAGQKYIKDAGNAIDKILKEADEMLDSSSKDGNVNKILDAVAGTQNQWDEKIKLVHDNYETIKKILEDDDELGADDPNKLTSEQRAIFQKGIEDSTKAELELTSEKMQAITNVIKQNVTDETQFITDKETELRRSRMSDYDRQIDEINALYDAKIDAKRKEIETLQQLQQQDGADTEGIQQQIDDIEKLIAKLEELKGTETSNVKKAPTGSNVWQKLIDIDWKNFKDNWRDNLQTMTAALQEFANAAFDIFNSINQIQSNRENAAFDEWCDIQDEKAESLQRQLDDGIISQKYYDAQMAKMQKEKEAKEKKIQHDQFEREKKANIIQATINGALAIVTAFAQLGPIAGAVAAVVTAATTAAQIAVMASQANPYAKGGYIKGQQFAIMGEEGDEWVASNKLVTDKKTAPLIAALDAYQRGNSSAIDELTTVTEPNWRKVSQSSRNLSRTFASQSQPVTNVYNTNSNNTTADNSELLKEIRQMNEYLKDPRNRQAYISRKTQLDFDTKESDIKAMARL